MPTLSPCALHNSRLNVTCFKSAGQSGAGDHMIESSQPPGSLERQHSATVAFSKQLKPWDVFSSREMTGASPFLEVLFGSLVENERDSRE